MTKQIRAIVESALEREPNFRERSKRYRGFTILLLKEFYPSLSLANFTQLTEFGQDFSVMLRTWNKVLEERKDLQGSDYNDKKMLEQEAQIGLGYEPGFHNDTARRTKRKIEEVPF